MPEQAGNIVKVIQNNTQTQYKAVIVFTKTHYLLLATACSKLTTKTPYEIRIRLTIKTEVMIL